MMSITRLVKDALRPVVGDMPERLQRLGRVRHLKASRPPVSKAGLVRDLAALPIRDRAIVLVHSSLKALGFVEGGADSVVDALIHAVVEKKGGTVMLPTFSIDGSMHRTLLSGRVFDVDETPSNLGAIPEAFRRHPLARRSLHPTHSLAAIGPLAERLVAGHHLAGTSFGDGSPMAEMLAADGYLLGLGTDLGHVTFYHCLEEIEDDFPLDVFTADSPIEARCRDRDGKLHHLMVNAHDAAVARTRIDREDNGSIRAYVQRQLEQRAGLTWHPVGDAPSWLVGAARLYAEIRRLMQAGITIYTPGSDLPGSACSVAAPKTTHERSRPE